MSETAPPRHHLALLQGVSPIDRARIPADVLAGITLAALAIPEVMGYTAIAGTPVVSGLYTILIPIAVFALIGSSRHLVVGADSATAAILAAGLVGLAPAESPQYVALASMAALVTAGWLLLARLIGLAFLADFLSRAVLIGFLTGVGIQVAAGQLAGMLGVPDGGSGTIDKALIAVSQIGQTNIPTLIVSVSVLVVIVGLRKVAKQIPGALIAVIGAIVASYALNLAAYGVEPLEPVPGGLPAVGIPDVTWTANSVGQLVTTSLAMFVVILAHSAATSRAYAARYEEHFDENADLLGLSLANVAAGLSGTFVVNGSPTKTQMVDSAGGRSQLSQLACAVVVLIVLLFLTGPLSYMPVAVLAAIVFLIGVELVDILGMHRILAMRPREFWVALLTAAIVVVMGVEQAYTGCVGATRRGRMLVAASAAGRRVALRGICPSRPGRQSVGTGNPTPAGKGAHMGIYDPFRELERMRRDMDRLFRETAGATSARPFRVAFLPGRGARQYPFVNIYQEGDDFRVEALAPGLDPSGVEVTAVRNTLTIRGEKVGLRDLAPERVHRSERAAGRFMRTVELPDEVDPDKVTAQYRNGLLLITAPRAAHARPRQVTVKAD